ncbi:BRO1-domain-containing protein [Boletus edulis]|nr:BRO1-domain-containing protein [Boletus edulis]
MSSHQSPMISIPRKTAEEVDWTTPIRNLIAKSYGENPETYAQEYQALQRCRQDAVKGAGSDMTGRDLLYKYFGQLELLELRFSEIRVNFSWHDAFTNKVTMQTSIAYEKASVLFQIAATHSAIAASQNRSNPEGLRLAFHYFRSCAGMLSYINDNFLHAPSTDLSREVIKFLVGIVLAQATEVFLEKCTDEKKANSLIAKIASQAAFMYTSLSEEAKDFMGKGIFRSKLGNHGESLSLAKESHRTAQSFSALWAHVSPTLPADAGASILERTKSHLQVCTDRKNEAQRDNDLIYNAVLPSSDALPAIDKASVATPTTIQEVYSAPEVQKIIGPDIFIKLIPLSVHESASVYSEEKAKLVRKEVENAESAEVEVRSALEAMGVQEGLGRFKAMAEGGIDAEDEIPLEVRRWREDIGVMEDRESVDALTRELSRLKDAVKSELESISRELDGESRECESMRVKYDHLWTQEPSASLNKSLRQDLKSHLNALEAAATSDKQVFAIWDTVKGDISLMLSSGLEELFRASVQRGGTESLLDLEISWETHDEQERAQIGQHTTEIEERLGRIKKIAYERNEVLKDLKEKIQADDVSHLLLLNRRNNNVEPALFAAELEKFRPYQQRLAATVHHQQIALQEIQSVWKSLRDTAGRGPGAKKWEEREKRKKDAIRRISRSRDGYMEVRDGLTKGLQFYNQLTELSSTLSRNVQSFVSERQWDEPTITTSETSSTNIVHGPRSSRSTSAPCFLSSSTPATVATQFVRRSIYSSLGQLGSTYYTNSSLSPRPPIPPPPPQRQSTFPPPPPPPQSQPSRQYTSSEYATSTTYPAPPPPMQYSFPPPLSSTPPRASTQYQPTPPPPQGYTQYHQGYRQ